MQGAANATRQLAAALGFTGALFAVVSVMRTAIKTIRDFQKRNAELAGVLNTTRDSLGTLRKDAERLGGSTAKTATEVTELQIAYARLGFTQSEILELTGDTINGSIALNAALDETAELTGAVVRTFDDLGTTDAANILDVMTAATQRSALNFEKLQTALPIVSGAANAAGISFTQLVSLLGKLSDAGIDASMSSTALRNIFIESAAQGLNYSQILEKIGNSQDKLTAANDEFGKRAAVSATILSNLTEETVKLEQGLNDVGGTAERVANEQLDTLDGRLTLLASAWDGLVLSIENGDGALGSFAQTAIDSFTDVLQRIKELNEEGMLLASILTLPTGGAKAIWETSEQIRAARALKAEIAIKRETEALQIFEQAQKDGVKTAEEFFAVQDEYINQYEDSEKRLIIAQKVLEKYDQTLEKNKETVQDVNEELQKQQDLFGDDDIIEYYEKLVAGTIKAKKATQDLGEDIGTIPDQVEEVIVGNDGAISKFEELIQKVQELGLVIQTAFQAGSIAVNQFFTNSSIRRENEFAQWEQEQNRRAEELQAQQDRALENESLTTQQRESLQEQYGNRILQIEQNIDNRRKQLQREQARREKAQAIFNAIINTAAAVVESLPDVGLSIAAGAIGAAQIAAIASQPLPAFKDGTPPEGHKGGLAIVGDGGQSELMITPDGQLALSDNKPQLVDLPKGSQVLSGAITERILKQSQLEEESIGNNRRTVDSLMKKREDLQQRAMSLTLKRENQNLLKGLQDTIKSIPQANWTIAPGGITKTVKKGNTIYKDVEEENKF
jgi:hypothetical protein